MSRQNHILHTYLNKKRHKKLLDKTVIVAAFVYPICGIPQVIDVFNGQTEGVSLAAWVGFIMFSLLFLFYGITHKIRPMIITNSLWLIVDGLVVIGLISTVAQI